MSHYVKGFDASVPQLDASVGRKTPVLRFGAEQIIRVLLGSRVWWELGEEAAGGADIDDAAGV